MSMQNTATAKKAIWQDGALKGDMYLTISILPPIERNEQRVLLTSQIAEAFETDSNAITVNFSRNKERYQEGKHFFLLQGEELAEFKRNLTNCNIAANTNRLYLWTEKGAWLIAKSLNTDKAWKAYSRLIDEYYDAKQAPVKALSPSEALSTVLRTTADLMDEQVQIWQEIQEVKGRLDKEITLNSAGQRKIQKAIAKAAYGCADSDATRRKYFGQIHRELRNRWGVPSYRDIRKVDLDGALAYIAAWHPICEEANV